jgi:uncharacterized protein (DUF58 family)
MDVAEEVPAAMKTYRYLEPAALARVRNLKLVARSVVEGFIAGLHSSPFKGFSSEFAEHRSYTRGDDLRHLDWKVLGRTNRYFVKQFEEETNLAAHILFDVSGSMGYGSEGGLTKFEYGCHLAAVLAYLLIRQRDSVGLVLFDEKVRVRMPAHSTAVHLNEMLRQLEICQPGRPTQVAGTFHNLAESFKRRCLIIIISDLYDEPEAVLKALHHFRHKRHEVILYHVFDHSELELDLDQVYNLVDAETGEKLQVDPAFVREDYQDRIAGFIEEYRRACNQSRVDYITTDTQVPYDLMLSAYLSKRIRLK